MMQKNEYCGLAVNIGFVKIQKNKLSVHSSSHHHWYVMSGERIETRSLLCSLCEKPLVCKDKNAVKYKI